LIIETQKCALPCLEKVRRADEYVIASNRGGSLRDNSVVNFFVAMFDEHGIDGCSSHSGRRTFITSARLNDVESKT